MVHIWRPTNNRAIALIKLTLWAGLLTWMVFFLAFGVTMAQRFGVAGPQLFGTGTWGQILTWVAPIWTVFTTLMLIWVVTRFANRRLRSKTPKSSADSHE